MHKILRGKLYFRQKLLGIICAKGVFHFLRNGVIMVTSYRTVNHDDLLLTFKTVRSEYRLLRILGLSVNLDDPQDYLLF